MPRLSRTALVEQKPEAVFNLVSDVESYPEFLPWCEYGQVEPIDNGIVHATVGISKNGFRKSFVTQNRLYRHERIEMTLVEGPFKYLHGYWDFTPLGVSGCKVSLLLEYQFVGGILGVMTAPVFNRFANQLVDAFSLRAQSLGD
ncbi:MAG TPA: ubiquinone-binding protein [Gammaproteobacteria bacterium]|nr:ubiquinone-binding protein [Gammaproteobacteria bacterium]